MLPLLDHVETRDHGVEHGESNGNTSSPYPSRAARSTPRSLSLRLWARQHADLMRLIVLVGLAGAVCGLICLIQARSYVGSEINGSSDSSFPLALAAKMRKGSADARAKRQWRSPASVC